MTGRSVNGSTIALGAVSSGSNPGALTRRGGRVVDCTGLENRQVERLPGFESQSLLQS